MNRIRIGIALFAFSLLGIAVFARILIQDAQKNEIHDINNTLIVNRKHTAGLQ